MSLTASPSARSLGARAFPEERDLPGRECGYSYPSSSSSSSKSPLLQVSSEHSTVSPRLNNKEPFRPMTRKVTRAASGERPSVSAAASPTIPSVAPSTQATPVASPNLSNAAQTAARPSSRLASSRAATAAVPQLVRASSPIKVSSPRISKPQASQLHAAPSSPTKAESPALTAPTVRPSSPVKIRAKITQGISPKRKQNARNASPPKPNIVNSISSSQVAAGPSYSAIDERAGLGISMSPPNHRQAFSPGEESETSVADASFVFAEPAGSASTSRSASSQAEAVTVHLRLRPLPASEPSAWVAAPLTASVSLQPSIGTGRTFGGGTHQFDAIHLGSSNDGLYKTLARPLVHSVLSGFNALVFAYGQTASGKTFTLSGDEKTGAEGITQKAVKDLFRGIRGSKKEREWLVRCSWLEVYNEGVKDLLDPTNAPQIRASQTKGTFVSPLAEVIVTSPAAVFKLLEDGQKHRHVNATDWNERSSRSHTAFKIVVESWARGEETNTSSASKGNGKKVRISELVLVDLAGSEKYVTQGGKERRAEGANINKSLLTLGKVIYALSERDTQGNNTSQMHIPYRDSKLTRILQNSLSGNSRIAVVATMNQSVASLEESLSTINFAKRIKKVRLSAKLNEVDAPESSAETQALLVRYRSEADALRRLVLDLQERQQEQERALDAATESVGQAVVEDRIEELEDRLRQIGRLVVRGEGSDTEDSDSETVWEVDGSPTKPSNSGVFLDSPKDAGESSLSRGNPRTPSSRPETPSHLDFTLTSTTLRQQLHAAHLRITSLQSKLSSRPSLPSRDLTAKDKDEMILRLQKQLAEAEIALEASTLQPLPKIREDVEAEYAGKLARLEKELKEARDFGDACQRECQRLERSNRRLIGLAHRDTAEMVGRLKEEASPRKALLPASPRADGSETPTMRRLRGMASTTSMRPRPMSVLGDVGMRGHHNGVRRRLDLDDEASLDSSLCTPKAAKTVTIVGATPSTNSHSQGSAPTSGLRRSTRSTRGGGGMTATQKSQEVANSGLTRSETIVMSLKDAGGSDEENADESALIDI